jgi:hypothetical protein
MVNTKYTLAELRGIIKFHLDNRLRVWVNVYSTTARMLIFETDNQSTIKVPVSFNTSEKLIEQFDSKMTSYGTYRLVDY